MLFFIVSFVVYEVYSWQQRQELVRDAKEALKQGLMRVTGKSSGKPCERFHDAQREGNVTTDLQTCLRARPPSTCRRVTMTMAE